MNKNSGAFYFYSFLLEVLDDPLNEDMQSFIPKFIQAKPHFYDTDHRPDWPHHASLFKKSSSVLIAIKYKFIENLHQ